MSTKGTNHRLDSLSFRVPGHRLKVQVSERERHTRIEMPQFTVVNVDKTEEPRTGNDFYRGPGWMGLKDQ